MSKTKILQELKALNAKVELLIKRVKDYQERKLQSLNSDADIAEYKTLKEIIENLEELV